MSNAQPRIGHRDHRLLRCIRQNAEQNVGRFFEERLIVEHNLVRTAVAPGS
jgi:hypothetical protein